MLNIPASALTIIVATLNAQNDLPRLTTRLGQNHPFMIHRLISDGGSDDATLDTARGLGWDHVCGPKGRGQQFALGAQQAKTPWLLFLHADSLPQPGWEKAVADFITQPAHTQKAAYFRFALATKDRQARWLETMVALRCYLLALPYGDQGLLIHRDLYQNIGGYRDLPLMEDVDLVRRLGRRHLHRLPAILKTSARRYQQSGYARRILRNAFCLSAYWLGISPHRIASFYDSA